MVRIVPLWKIESGGGAASGVLVGGGSVAEGSMAAVEGEAVVGAGAGGTAQPPRARVRVKSQEKGMHRRMNAGMGDSLLLLRTLPRSSY
jgi:hypothetical protein